MSEHLFKTIVVATDGSSTAATAIAKGVELASFAGGDVKLVGAFESTKRQAELEAALATTAAELQAAGVNVETFVRKGDPVDVVIETAEELSADLIVVGSVGMQSAKRFFVGAIPDKISHHAECSVLVVRTTG
ncbi:MAG: universal stress protein [Solirubrobacteraceae bacterium]|nr:universal stress protein [Solirubrobacteraceae bacterium]